MTRQQNQSLPKVKIPNAREKLTMTRRSNRPRTGTFVALDIGTSKVCCLIAQVDRPAVENGANFNVQPRVIGSGLQLNAGLKNGVIVDLDVAETAIRKAVFSAEELSLIHI